MLFNLSDCVWDDKWPFFSILSLIDNYSIATPFKPDISFLKTLIKDHPPHWGANTKKDYFKGWLIKSCLNEKENTCGTNWVPKIEKEKEKLEAYPTKSRNMQRKRKKKCRERQAKDGLKKNKENEIEWQKSKKRSPSHYKKWSLV